MTSPRLPNDSGVISSAAFSITDQQPMADETLSDEELDQIFRRMVDSFIDKANELAESNGSENVGMALLYAASRFNAHVVSKHAENQQAYEKDLPRARKFFNEQYQSMLDENLEDYKSVYGKYANFMRRQ
jgi:hypothetical protein